MVLLREVLTLRRMPSTWKYCTGFNLGKGIKATIKQVCMCSHSNSLSISLSQTIKQRHTDQRVEGIGRIKRCSASTYLSLSLGDLPLNAVQPGPALPAPDGVHTTVQHHQSKLRPEVKTEQLIIRKHLLTFSNASIGVQKKRQRKKIGKINANKNCSITSQEERYELLASRFDRVKYLSMPTVLYS